jgi:hypothetical protein
MRIWTCGFHKWQALFPPGGDSAQEIHCYLDAISKEYALHVGLQGI